MNMYPLHKVKLDRDIGRPGARLRWLRAAVLTLTRTSLGCSSEGMAACTDRRQRLERAGLDPGGPPSMFSGLLGSSDVWDATWIINDADRIRS